VGGISGSVDITINGGNFVLGPSPKSGVSGGNGFSMPGDNKFGGGGAGIGTGGAGGGEGSGQSGASGNAIIRISGSPTFAYGRNTPDPIKAGVRGGNGASNGGGTNGGGGAGIGTGGAGGGNIGSITWGVSGIPTLSITPSLEPGEWKQVIAGDGGTISAQDIGRGGYMSSP
jgi:hypothetical protein